MADLTATLPNVQADTTVARSGVTGGGIISGIADSVGNIFSGVEAFQNNTAKIRANQEAQTKFQQEQGDRAVTEQAARGVFGALHPDVPGVQTFVPTPALAAQVQGAQKVQAAVQQGNYPAAALAARVESVVSFAVQQHPENAAAALDWVKAQGFDHYLNRDADLSSQQDKLQQDAQDAAQTAAYKTAADHGKTGDFNSMVAYGTQQQGLDAQIASQMQATQIQAAVDAHTGFEQTQKDKQLTELNKTSLNTLFAKADSLVPVLMDNVTTAVAAAGTDSGKLDTLQTETLPLLLNGLETARTHFLAQSDALNLGKEGQDSVNGYFDSKTKSLTDIFSGPNSQVETNVRALKGLQTQWGLDAATSVPVYSQLKAIYGPQTINSILTGDPSVQSPFSPDQLKQLKQEALQVQIAPDPNSQAAHLALFSQIAKGQVHLSQLPENQAIQQMPNLISTTNGNQAAILQKGDKTAIPGWATSYDNLVWAANSIQPGTPDAKSVQAATAQVSSTGAKQVLDLMIKDPTTHDQGLQIMQASRSTAARLLTIQQGVGVNTDNSGVLSIQFKNGSYQVVADPNAYQKFYKGLLGNLSQATPGASDVGGFTSISILSSIPTYQQLVKQGDAALTAKVNTLNTNLGYLSATSQYDDQLPKGMTKQQITTFYATGSLPVGVKPPTPPGATADADFGTLVGKIRDEAQQLPTQLQADPELKLGSTAGPGGLVGLRAMAPVIHAASGAAGVNETAASMIVGHESAFNPNANVRDTKAPGWEKSHAFGLTQLQPGTAHDLGLKVPGYDPQTKKYVGGPNGAPLAGDERLDPQKNALAGLTYFKQLVDKHGGDVIAAGKEFSGGQWSAGFLASLAAAYNQKD